ncbi:MAG: tripartite tricarboxylate transporter permease [Ferrovibrio sp.]|uniref:tripartite tricarboxylate transporter permease n=1 Tax=Ferrovibrio sp. TaxID=1917215 RepID=UPI00261B5572|nr:tripartite tricarboxylate transporter permease [Ferrovibrio sp.]MCW0233893.1 tripartite tricarboxylate transporter permease [Ferrovibrio sp.]
MAEMAAQSGRLGYTFGLPQLMDGIGFVIVAMGIFGLGEIVGNIEHEATRRPMVKTVTGLMLTRAEFLRILPPILRGTLLGSLLGILPGGGAMLASFGAYALEKKVSPNAAEFGHGAIEGVAAPESANNAGAQTSFIPMLTLGIPSNPVMAMMIGALMLHGIQPGPMVMTQQPTLFWGIIASMSVGNLFLLVLNLPLVGLWVRMISVPYHLLYPAILAFCVIGVFSLNNATFDVWLMSVFGLLGYLFRKFAIEPAPMLLGFILGPMMEEYLRRALLVSRGDPMVFITHPASAAMLALSLLLLAIVLAPALRRTREQAFQES